MREIAIPYIPNGVNEKSLFYEYKGEIVEKTIVTGNYQGDIFRAVYSYCEQWAKVQRNSGDGSIVYDMGAGHGKFIRNSLRAKQLNQPEVTFKGLKPIFVPKSSDYFMFDCSSTALFLFYNINVEGEGFIKDNVQELNTFATESFSDIVEYLNSGKILKKNYKAIKLDITEDT
jgi:hypothetical protein